MAITSVTAGGQQYNIEVSQEGGVKTTDEASITKAVTDITPELLSQIEHRLLKDGVAIKLADGRTVTSEEQLDALKHLESFNSGDVLIDSMELMKVFQQCAMTMRKAGREQRAAELSSQISALNSAADEMKKAAAQHLAAGIVQGAMGIAAGCVQIGAGAVQIGQAGTALDAGTEAAKTTKSFDEATAKSKQFLADGNEALSKTYAGKASGLKATAAEQTAEASYWGSRAQATGQIGTGVSQVVSSSGGIVSSVLTYQAAEHEHAKGKLEAEAKVHEAGVEHAKEMMQQALEIIQDVKDKIAAIQQAQAETNRGIARNV
ncbi:type III secretion system translocon subunit SctB [Propionivibrio soli]|uniref:type III secretion system translocon subunit SctB n=1 Tax=Propionivibrio soli TaxID=2976531 RepID=UPI0021E8F96B|nr:type III secretion system translocon subunit SctB [Propionivibrio soli]